MSSSGSHLGFPIWTITTKRSIQEILIVTIIVSKHFRDEEI